MLPSVRNKATMSILDRLKQKGMPTAPAGEFNEEAQPAVEDPELNAMGQTLRAAGPSVPVPMPAPRKKKPLPVPSIDEEAYE